MIKKQDKAMWKFALLTLLLAGCNHEVHEARAVPLNDATVVTAR